MLAHSVRVAALSCLIALVVCGSSTAQTPPPAPPAPPAPLFQSSVPVALRIETDLRALLRDRGEKRVEHGAILHFRDAADSGSVHVDLRTRGIFRLNHCGFPPIRIDLPKNKLDGTLFAGQDKLKLVTHCQSDRSFERNLLREYALYRAFNVLTDTSLRVRLARVTYIDTTRADTVTRYGFLIESDVELARRIAAKVLATGQVRDFVTDPSYMTLVAVFQYLIGNTDWSVTGRHNITILRDTANPQTLFAVPYDFDFSGAVGAPYATTPPQLPIRSVRERLYRGYCQPDSLLHAVLDRFRLVKDSIYAIVRAVPDLPERDVRGLLSYFDEFYEVIDNRGLVSRNLSRGCRQVPQ